MKVLVLLADRGEETVAGSSEEKTRELLLSLCSAGLSAAGRTTVMTPADLKTLFDHEASRQLLAVGEEGATELGAAVDADYVVSVLLLPSPSGGATLALHALDPMAGSSVHRETGAIGLADDFSKAVTAAATRLKNALVAHHLQRTGGLPRERSWLGRRGGIFWGTASAGLAATLGGGALLVYSGSRTSRHNEDATAYQDWIDAGMPGGTRPVADHLLDASQQQRTRQLWAGGWIALGGAAALFTSGALLDRPLPRFVTVSSYEDSQGSRGLLLAWGAEF